MAPYDREQVYNQACARWGGDLLSADQYHAHLRRLGVDEANHIEDLLASGAAGLRQELAWQRINHMCRGPAIRVLRRYRSGIHEPEDLWNAAMEKMARPLSARLVSRYDMSESESQQICGGGLAQIVLFLGQISLLSYCLTAARRIAYTQSQRAENAPVVNTDLASAGVYEEQEQGLAPEQFKQLRVLLSEEFESWSSEEAFLFRARLQGRANKDICKILGFKDESKGTRLSQRLAGRVSERLGKFVDLKPEGLPKKEAEQFVTEILRLLQLRLGDGSSM